VYREALRGQYRLARVIREEKLTNHCTRWHVLCDHGESSQSLHVLHQSAQNIVINRNSLNHVPALCASDKKKARSHKYFEISWISLTPD
jgi:hypothetical protein